MISNEKANFFTAHYEWLVVGFGALALVAAAAFYVMAIGDDPDEAAQVEVAAVKNMKPAKTGVVDVDLTAYQTATKVTKIPVVVSTFRKRRRAS